MTRIPKISFIELGLMYEIYPPYADLISSKQSPASIELITDFDIPESIWELYKDDEQELLKWTIANIVIPGLVNFVNNRDAKFDDDEEND